MSVSKSSLKELSNLFLRLGVTAFGGPAAHIAMMQKEIVEKRKWMSHNHFLDLMGATNLIPGPNSTEMAIHIGRERAGLKGLLVAGCCFIFPAVLITLGFAWLYKQYGHLPRILPFLSGIKPAIIAIILAAVLPLGKKAAKSAGLVILGFVALALSFLGVDEVYIIFGAGFFYLLFSLAKSGLKGRLTAVHPSFLQMLGTWLLSVSNANLFWVFLKIGSILYGSGYVLFAYLNTELVEKGWLSRQQLIDAIAVGQLTPGPVFSSVTFIGFQMQGLTGAVLSTVAVFLPSFAFVWLLNPLIPRMRRSVHFGRFLDAVNMASITAVIYVCYQMGIDTLKDWRSVLIGIIALLTVFGFRRINTVFVLLGSSLLGYLLSMV
jgi:chromate transporter